MLDVAIIGGGIFGCVIGKTLREGGLKVEIFDSQENGRASPAAACLMKPGWFSGFEQEEVKRSLALLDYLYGVKEIPFVLKGMGIKVPRLVPVYWVNPESILSEPKTIGKAKVVYNHEVHDKDYPLGVLVDNKIIKCKKVIVAAGIWSGDFIKHLKVEPKAGVVFRSPGRTEPTIDVWAPYKQLVAFNIDSKTVWAGDGTALKPESLTGERITKSAARCAPYLGAAHEVIVGYRPYVKDAKPAYLVEEEPGLWCATGGAKNGTIAAAWCALQIKQALEHL